MNIAVEAPMLRRPSVALLVAISAVNPLAINMFMPSMPRMTAVFGTTYAMVQLTLSLYLATVAVAQSVIGPLSDRYGRRPVLIGGMMIFVVGSAVAVFAPTIEILLAGRVLQGAGGCAGIVLARAIVRDLYDRDEAASMIGYVTMGMAVAPMIAPAIGGVLEEWVGWQGSFAVMLATGIGATVWSLVALHETNPNRGRRGPVGSFLRDWAALLRIPLFWAYCGTTGFGSAVFFAFLGGAPLVTADIMKASPLDYGLWFILVSFGYIAGNFLTGRFAARAGVVTLITFGNAIQLAAVALMTGLFAAGHVQMAALFVPMMLVGLANGLTIASSIAGSVSIRPDLAGAAAGLGGTFQIGVGAIASSMAGALLVTVMPGTVWALVGLMVGAAVLAMASGIAVLVFTRT